MKNLFLLIVTALILVSCSNTTEQQKLEIEQKIEMLQAQIKEWSVEQNQLKEHLGQVVLKYESRVAENLSEADRKIVQIQFRNDVQEIEIRQDVLKQNEILNELEIRKLKQEYLRY